MSKQLEDGTDLLLDFKKLKKVANIDQDVVPVILQHAQTGQVLTLAYTNEEAFKQTLSTKQVALWSTSRNELWEKGKTSGDTLRLQEVLINCEQNSLLYKVLPQGNGACHTKDSQGKTRNTCYYRQITDENNLAFNETE